MTNKEAWTKFEKENDWSYANRQNWPTLRECFLAGFEAGLCQKCDNKQIVESFIVNPDKKDE